MELDVATLNGPVLIFEPCVIHVRDGRRVEELDGKLVSAPTRFHDVVDFNAVRKATRTIDLRGPRDYPVIGPIQPLKVAGHARAMHLNRRIRAVIVVLEVTEVVDHDWAKSIYFKDPNGMQLEYCCFTRNLNANDARMQDRFEMSVRRLGLEENVTEIASIRS